MDVVLSTEKMDERSTVSNRWSVTLQGLKTIREIFGENVRANRVRHGMSQLTLATHVGLSETAISQLELGRRWPKFSNVAAIAEVLDVDDFELFTAKTASSVKPTPLEALSALGEFVEKHSVPTGIPDNKFELLLQLLRTDSEVRGLVLGFLESSPDQAEASKKARRS